MRSGRERDSPSVPDCSVLFSFDTRASTKWEIEKNRTEQSGTDGEKIRRRRLAHQNHNSSLFLSSLCTCLLTEARLPIISLWVNLHCVCRTVANPWLIQHRQRTKKCLIKKLNNDSIVTELFQGRLKVIRHSVLRYQKITEKWQKQSDNRKNLPTVWVKSCGYFGKKSYKKQVEIRSLTGY